jgi:type VI protein secretion system component VasK
VDTLRRKPRAQRTRRAFAAGSVVAALSLGGAMAWSDAHASNSKAKTQTSATTHESDESDESDDWSSESRSVPSSSSASTTVTPHTSTGGS